MNKILQFKIMTKKCRGVAQKMLLLFVLLCPMVAMSGTIEDASEYILNQLKETKITLDLKNKSLDEILLAICKQAKVKYGLHSSVKVNKEVRYSLNVKGVSVETALNQLLKDSSYDYKIEGDRIIVVNKVLKTQPKSTAPIGITGKVVENGKPIVGATVIVVGTGNGAISDDKGNFILKAPLGTKAEVSYVGYKTKIVELASNNVVIHLEADLMQVDDVVVTGIFDRSKESYTGAVTHITEKELKSFGNRNVIATIGNIDPSFNIMRNNEWGSDPNRLPEIQIRGAASLPDVKGLQNDMKANLNTPLIIMDGFEITLQRMMDMDDDEISSITLLKDGSATSIYGSRGANGVVVITTKAPKAGKLTINYTGGIDIEMPDLSDYDLLNAREKLDLEVKSGYFRDLNPTKNVELQQYYYDLLSNIERGIDTDWLAQPLQTGIGHRHNLRVQGGDEVFRYSASVQYRNTVGVMKGTDRQNMNATINLTYNTKKVTFSNSLTLGSNKSATTPYGTFSAYAEMNPYWAPYDDDGRFIKTYDSPAGYYTKAPSNPMYNSTLNTFQTNDYTNISNNLNIEWKPFEGFTARGKLGFTKNMSNSDNFKPADHTDFVNYKDDDVFRKGSYSYGTNNGNSYSVSLTVNYVKTIKEKHNITAGASYDVSQNKSRNYGFAAEGFVHEDINFLATALQYKQNGKPSGNESMSRRVGIVANVNYSFDNRFFVDGSFRKDGSSQFGSNKSFGNFYSLGLGWNLHNEKFMKDKLEFISRLRLKGSYGKTGSQQFSAYQGKETYKYYLDKSYYAWMGAYQSELGNENLEWQTTDKYNVGLEVGLFNNRVTANVDFYYDQTGNLLSSMDLPYSNGFNNYSENIGSVENKGFELRVTGYLIRDTKRQITWSVTGNLVTNRDKITKLSEAMKAENEKNKLKGGTSPNRIIREGDSQNTIYVVPSYGIDPSNGQELYRTIDGGITYDWNARDRVACGLSEPLYRGNFSSAFRYKNLSFNISFGYLFGGQLYNSTLINKVENADMKVNVDRRVYTQRWAKPGDISFYKGLNNNKKTNNTSRFVENESTLNCQSINLAYDWRTKWLKEKLGITSLSVNANMNELFQQSTVHRERGTSYPYSRLFSMGVSIIF